MLPKLLLRCLLACLICLPVVAASSWPVALWPGQQVWTLDSGCCIWLRPSVVVTPRSGSIGKQDGTEVAKLPGYKSQRLTRPPWPPARAQTRCSSLLGVIPAATNVFVLHTL